MEFAILRGKRGTPKPKPALLLRDYTGGSPSLDPIDPASGALPRCRLHHNFDFSGGIAFEMMQAVALGVDELHVELVWRDVDVVEAETLVVDETAVGQLDVVQLRAAGAGDNEARIVVGDLHVLHDVVMAGKAE